MSRSQTSRRSREPVLLIRSETDAMVLSCLGTSDRSSGAATVVDALTALVINSETSRTALSVVSGSMCQLSIVSRVRLRAARAAVSDTGKRKRRMCADPVGVIWQPGQGSQWNPSGRPTALGRARNAGEHAATQRPQDLVVGTG